MRHKIVEFFIGMIGTWWIVCALLDWVGHMFMGRNKHD